MQNGMVVYKISPYSQTMLGAILFSIGVIVLITFIVNAIRNKNWVRTVGMSLMLIAFSIAGYILINGTVLTYNQTYKVYHAGEYSTVSGQIKNMKVDDNDAVTRLSIGNVQFVLQDDMAGFSQRDFRNNQDSNSPDKLKNGDFVTIKYVHSKYEWHRAGNKYTILYIEKNKPH